MGGGGDGGGEGGEKERKGENTHSVQSPVSSLELYLLVGPGKFPSSPHRP